VTLLFARKGGLVHVGCFRVVGNRDLSYGISDSADGASDGDLASRCCVVHLH